MTYDASNRKDIRAAEKATAELANSHLTFLRGAMDSPFGRLFFYHLLSECQCFVDVPTFNQAQDYFASGRRSVGLRLMSEILTHCPNQYIQMIGEENARIAATERSRSQSPGRDASGREGYPDDSTEPDTGTFFGHPDL